MFIYSDSAALIVLKFIVFTLCEPKYMNLGPLNCQSSPNKQVTYLLFLTKDHLLSTFLLAGGVNASAGVLFFFRCRKLGCRSWAKPLYSIPIAI